MKKLLLIFSAIFVALWLCYSRWDQNLNFGFDAQNAHVWQYTARIGMLPYRDVFYPYGLLFYFQNTLSVALLGTLLVSIFTFYVTAAFLESWWFVLFFSVFSVRFIGFETWSRYGIGTCAALMIPSLLRKPKVLSSVLIGVCTGLLFGLVQDQAVYVALIFFFCAALQRRNVLALFLQFATGLLLGGLPFLGYLIYTQSLVGFVYQAKYLGLIAHAAKTPFIPFALSPSNVFVFAILFYTLCELSYQLISQRKSLSPAHYVKAALVFFIILLEQKSILRSIDWQIVLPALVLLMQQFKNKLPMWACVIILFLLTFFYPFRLVSNPSVLTNKNQAAYVRVIDWLLEQKDYAGKLFTYPGDPIFYEFTGQKPPYFFTSYETTPSSAQEKIIEYIQSRDIHYVVYNTAIAAIQDGVPNGARNPLEFKFLISHFEAKKIIGPFLVLQAKQNVDVNKICIFVPVHEICDRAR